MFQRANEILLKMGEINLGKFWYGGMNGCLKLIERSCCNEW